MGQRIRALRERKALSLETLERLSGVMASTISEIELGKRQRRRRPRTIHNLAQALGVSVEYLTTGSSQPVEPAVPQPETGKEEPSNGPRVA